jgi:MFS family permease
VTPLTRQQPTLAVGMVLGVTLVAFEMTAVITALPTMADRRGPARPYALSLATFITGLLVAAAAPNMGVMVIGRALQGAGTGGLAPIAYVLVTRAFPDDRQPTVTTRTPTRVPTAVVMAAGVGAITYGLQEAVSTRARASG